MSTINPEVAALVAWSEEFEAGMINDPALIDGTLVPGERMAARAAPITSVTLQIKQDGPVVTAVGDTGIMLATDRRVLLQVTGGDTQAWSWADDVGRVTPLRNYLGASWNPSVARYEAGVRIEGLVVPEFARGARPLPSADPALRSLWVKVTVAWRASQPGGVAAWREPIPPALRRVTGADLGVFTAAELRAGGINSRGFLQPLLPGPADVDVTAQTRAAADGLASRGLLARRAAGWQPIGRFERLLVAAAVARALLAIGPASPDARGFGTPRLVLGCLGTTSEVLDLWPRPDGYHARLLDVGDAAGELVDCLGLGPQDGERAGPAGERPAGEGSVRAVGEGSVRAVGEGAVGEAPAGDRPGVVSDLDPGWDRVDKLLRGGVATLRVEAASVIDPVGPLRQHRLTLISTSEADWLLLGAREGARAARTAAVADSVQVRRLLEALLRGGTATL